MSWRDWFSDRSDLIWDRDRWRRRAIVNEEHLEYWQGTSKFYRRKWDEALALLPKEKAEELIGNSVKEYP